MELVRMCRLEIGYNPCDVVTSWSVAGVVLTTNLIFGSTEEERSFVHGGCLGRIDYAAKD